MWVASAVKPEQGENRSAGEAGASPGVLTGNHKPCCASAARGSAMCVKCKAMGRPPATGSLLRRTMCQGVHELRDTRLPWDALRSPCCLALPGRCAGLCRRRHRLTTHTFCMHCGACRPPSVALRVPSSHVLPAGICRISTTLWAGGGCTTRQ
jgi:hypothetical protein